MRHVLRTLFIEITSCLRMINTIARLNILGMLLIQIKKKKIYPGWHTPCYIESYITTVVYAMVFPASHTHRKGERKMKKLAIQLFVIGTIIATYTLPVLAMGGAGY